MLPRGGGAGIFKRMILWLGMSKLYSPARDSPIVSAPTELNLSICTKEIILILGMEMLNELHVIFLLMLRASSFSIGRV
jgi:hypothetical protein